MNTITLEMVDAVIERTGATYTEAKEALMVKDGDVLEAIVYIEALRDENAGNKFAKEVSNKTGEIVENVKEFIKKGNVTSLIVEKDERVLLDIPVTVGGVAAIAFAIPTLIGALAAFGMGCVVKIKQDNGEIINVSDSVYGAVDDFKGKFSGKDSQCEDGSCDEEVAADSTQSEEESSEEKSE